MGRRQTPPGFTGRFAPNTRLSGLRMIDTGGEVGPEHIAIGPDGKLYAAMTSGDLLRMEPDGGRQEVFATTGGRVLGFDFDAQRADDRRRRHEGAAGHRRGPAA